MSTQVSIERAELRHIDEIAPLFDAYRRFYGQVDEPRARSFLEERLVLGAVHEPLEHDGTVLDTAKSARGHRQVVMQQIEFRDLGLG